jgi:hypothetical protein
MRSLPQQKPISEVLALAADAYPAGVELCQIITVDKYLLTILVGIGECDARQIRDPTTFYSG